MNNINKSEIKNTKKSFEVILNQNNYSNNIDQKLFKSFDKSIESFEQNIKNKALNLFNKSMFNELFSFLENNIRNFPSNLVLLNLFGISQYKKGLNDRAYDTFKKVLKIAPQNADALNSISIILNERKNFDEAVSFLKKASKLQPKNSSIFNNLGLSYAGLKKYDLSIYNFLKAIKLDSNYDAKRNLYNVKTDQFISLKDYKSAEELLLTQKQEIEKEKQPDDFDLLSNLLYCFFMLGKMTEAENLCKEVINKKNKSYKFFYNAAYFYGIIKINGRKAVEYSQKALELSPNNLETLLNLSYYYFVLLRDHSTALKILKKMLILYPNDSRILNNIGNIFEKNGFHNSALHSYVQALKLNPDDLKIYNSLLFTISLMPNLSDGEVFNEFLKFGDKYNNPKKMFNYHKCSKNLQKKIKLGFVSGDFREHAIKQSLLPVFQNLDKEKFDIHSYSTDIYEDAATLQFKYHSKYWVSCKNMNDFELAQKIWNDKIDILFDMSGHTSGNRLITFTYKPAPIQISWMGWPLTTGLSAMDYAIYDNYTAPLTADPFFVEKIIRLPNNVNFIKPKDLSKFRPKKEREHKDVIFASFNHSRKLNEDIIECWCEILKKIKGSKIVIANLEQLTFDWVANKLIKNGIEKHRFELLSPLGVEEYLKLHTKIDLLLDTWPYTGGTTTYYAMRYGIPVITLSGKSIVHNQSSGILKNFGITEGIVFTKDEYIAKAVELGADIEQLYQLKLKNFEKYKNYVENKQNDYYGHLENLLTRLCKEYRDRND